MIASVMHISSPAPTQPAGNHRTSLTTESKDAQPAPRHSVTSANCSDCIAAVQLLHINTRSAISSSSLSSVTARHRFSSVTGFHQSTALFQTITRLKVEVRRSGGGLSVRSLIFPDVRKCCKRVSLLNNQRLLLPAVFPLRDRLIPFAHRICSNELPIWLHRC